MRKKRSICLLLASLIATTYLIYIVSYFAKGSDTDGGAIATMLVLPHIIVLLIGVLFGWIGYFSRKAVFSLVASILYSVSAALFFLYALFLVPSIILGFVGYSNQKKLSQMAN